MHRVRLKMREGVVGLVLAEWEVARLGLGDGDELLIAEVIHRPSAQDATTPVRHADQEAQAPQDQVAEAALPMEIAFAIARSSGSEEDPATAEGKPTAAPLAADAPRAAAADLREEMPARQNGPTIGASEHQTEWDKSAFRNFGR
ncbi:MAG: hypothetical protein ACFBRM_00315 [Pikeienuella sp.]